MNKFTIISFIFIYIMSCISVSKCYAVENPEECDKIQYERISIYALISNPNKYKNKHIRTYGYFMSGFEDETLFVNKESYEHYVFENGIRLYFPLEYTDELKEFDGHLAELKGVFKISRTSTGRRWPSLADICFPQRWIELLKYGYSENVDG